MTVSSQVQSRITTKPSVRSRRAWARIAGLAYWLVLVVDITGMQLHSGEVRTSLMLAGSLFTVPLALGLYYAVNPAQSVLAAAALVCRLTEAALGLLSTVTGFKSVHAAFAHSSMGTALLNLAEWDDRTAFAAFIFTVGSTLFFYLFLKSGSIPRVLSGWGLFASLLAMAACGAHLLRPAFPAMTMYAWLPMLLAETSTGSWLLIKSVKAGA